MSLNKLSQEEFDSAVKSNIEELEMDEEEAVREAVSMFEGSGYTLNNIKKDFYGNSGRKEGGIPRLELEIQSIKNSILTLYSKSIVDNTEEQKKFLISVSGIRHCITVVEDSGIAGDVPLYCCKAELLSFPVTSAIVVSDLLYTILKSQPDYLNVDGIQPQLTLINIQSLSEEEQEAIKDENSPSFILLFCINNIIDNIRKSGYILQQVNLLTNIIHLITLIIDSIRASCRKHESNRGMFVINGIIDMIKSVIALCLEIESAFNQVCSSSQQQLSKQKDQFEQQAFFSTLHHPIPIPSNYILISLLRSSLQLCRVIIADDDIRSTVGHGFEYLAQMVKQASISLIGEILSSLAAFAVNKEVCTKLNEKGITTAIINILQDSYNTFEFIKHKCIIINPKEQESNSDSIELTKVSKLSIFNSEVSSLLSAITSGSTLIKGSSSSDDIKRFYTQHADGQIAFILLQLMRECCSDQSQHTGSQSILNITSPQITSVIESCGSALSSLLLRNKDLSYILSQASMYVQTSQEADDKQKDVSVQDNEKIHLKSIRSKQGCQIKADFIEVSLLCLRSCQHSSIAQQQLCQCIRNSISRCVELKEAFLLAGVEPLLRRSMALALQMNQSSDGTQESKGSAPITNTLSTSTPASSPLNQEFTSWRARALYEAAHSALRDLGCEVELKEMWQGKGINLKK
ncbi:MAG: hypothetical protein EZS28_006265 [Streblomastix strix]|uniref:Uncharacterized protein n=1 Tax=Streblomastix strix TaxID=222440 RepID=A0A5J4WUG7_9EUKA|nr:MAG: hypothetical protein EZS28_006265 [Streblomastix strix]